MAITKTTFRNDSLALQEPEVFAWLQENATAYFDEITYDTQENKIVCKIGDNVALELPFNSDPIKAYLNNGASISIMRGFTTSDSLYIAGIATNNALCLSYSGKIQAQQYLIITKDNNGDVTFISHGREPVSGGASDFRLRTGTFTKYVWNDWYGSQTVQALFQSPGYMGVSAAMTSLIPFTDKTYPIYTPNCYKLEYNQYFGLEGQFTIDGTDYYTTGFIALSD